jgi:hypothetical protein
VGAHLLETFCPCRTLFALEEHPHLRGGPEGRGQRIPGALSEDRHFRLSRSSPHKVSFHPPGLVARGGLRTPAKNRLGYDRGMSPLGHRPPVPRLLGRNEMPRALRTASPLRARRPRPSEKTALHVIPGVSPARPSQLGLSTPRRGGLCTPAGKTCARPKHLPIRPPAARSLLGDHAIPGACVRPRNADARSASLRENRPSPTRMGEPNPLGTRTAWFSSSGNPTTN